MKFNRYILELDLQSKDGNDSLEEILKSNKAATFVFNRKLRRLKGL